MTVERRKGYRNLRRRELDQSIEQAAAIAAIPTPDFSNALHDRAHMAYSGSGEGLHRLLPAVRMRISNSVADARAARRAARSS